MTQKYISNENTRNKYQKIAWMYNYLNGIFSLLLRVKSRRRLAIKALGLNPGDTVVDLCCGTGVNFLKLKREIGSEGSIIGVDLTPAMLNQAKKRILKNKIQNIQLVNTPAQKYQISEDIDAVFISFAITIIPEYDQVIQVIAENLRPGKKLVILELKRSNKIPKIILNLFQFVLKPLGFKKIQLTYTPWKSMEKYFDHCEIKEFFFGTMYMAVGYQSKKSRAII